MTDVYTAYYDRKKETIEGAFTIQKFDGEKVEPVFHRISSRSGQSGWTNSDWTRGKSPIPKGQHLLWLKPSTLQMAPGGDFFPISSHDENQRIITNRFSQRWDVGLHEENNKPGSAGCIVILKHDDFKEISEFLKELGKTQEHIKIVVL